MKKTLITTLATALMLLSFGFTTQAVGPEGQPPTQNISPTFGDVVVKGKIMSDGNDFRIEASPGKGIFIGSGSAPNNFSVTSTDAISLVSAVLNFMGDSVFNNKLTVNGELVTSTISSATKELLLKAVTTVEGGLKLTYDGTKQVVWFPNQNEETLVIQDNNGNGTLKFDGRSIVASDQGLIVEAPGSFIDLASSLGTTLGININKETSINGDLTVNGSLSANSISGIQKIANDLSVNGHFKASSIGKFMAKGLSYKMTEYNETIPVYCDAGYVRLSCMPGFVIDNSVFLKDLDYVTVTKDPKTHKPLSPPLEGCSATFQVNDEDAGTATFTDIGVSAMCFNPNL